MSLIDKLLPINIKNVFVNFLIEYKTFKTLVKNYKHWETVCSKKSIQNGKPIPWYTYPAIEFFTQFDYSSQLIFEFGSGNSSLFWADRCKHIVSIEDDETWFKQIYTQKRSNQEIKLIQKKEEYINSIKGLQDNPDIVIIDGSHRFECAKVVAEKVNDKTLLILDNSDWYPDTCKYLRSKKYIQIDFSGFGPIVCFTTTTSIFFTAAYSFILKNERQPMPSLGAIKGQCDYQ